MAENTTCNGALPLASSPTVTLAHPTIGEKKKQLLKNGQSWRGALSLDSYLLREAHLADQDATRNGGHTSWVLVDGGEGPQRNVLCGCETYRKKALVAWRGGVKDATVHGVGSVFCPPDRRGRGYAGRMMKELGKKLETWQSEEQCPFSILFSDIGKVRLCTSPYPGILLT